MDEREVLQRLVVTDDAPIGRRAAVLGAALFASWLGLYVVTPRVGDWLSPLLAVDDPALQRFLGHVLTYSLPAALVAGALWGVFVGQRILWAPQTRPGARRALIEGAVAAFVLSLAVCLAWADIGFDFHWDLSLWNMAGNLFSNAYEEVLYRGLVFGAALYAFRRGWAAVLVSTLAFVATHAAYPPHLIAVAAAGGVAMGLVYLRTGNLLAPWLAHQITDMILDTILVV